MSPIRLSLQFLLVVYTQNVQIKRLLVNYVGDSKNRIECNGREIKLFLFRKQKIFFKTPTQCFEVDLHKTKDCTRLCV